MFIDPTSDRTIDITASITRTYLPHTTAREKKLLRKHLAFILPKLTEPNTLIEPVRQALEVLRLHEGIGSWIRRHTSVLPVTIVAGLIITVLGAYIVYRAAWTGEYKPPARPAAVTMQVVSEPIQTTAMKKQPSSVTPSASVLSSSAKFPAMRQK
ncbi:hypothetical protein D0T25_23905 [Duganella sp. BJB488]|uniref:hypothetical protein n=1 Tax=unclassified Duganella TaxID=2636909 RepID=UPI000E35085F|nr:MULTISPECIES: hypothetical protein [unclassified Duganella]RFP13293.1 hypothetical protein D0T26_23715 [Duganella sp. BJB489]RFP17131.1 hypothetical protein D0T25_23905 [Duganella sp. BJB488]RFP31650.1 hypothetical protein D0T24_24810 [Duganella sp. BJB480]